jgi:hypothetical protein
LKAPVALLLATALPLASFLLACNGVLGLDAFQKIDARASDSGIGEVEAGPDAPSSPAPNANEAGADGIDKRRRWVRWSIPRGARQPGDYTVRNGEAEDGVTKLIWLVESKPATTLDEARAACAVGPGWTVPTRAELLSLVDPTRSEPAIEVQTFPDTATGPSSYWTVTQSAARKPVHIDFQRGATNIGAAQRVRCVRRKDFTP